MTKIKLAVRQFGQTAVAYVIFLWLLLLVFVRFVVKKLSKGSLVEKVDKFMEKVDGKKEGEVSRIYLIELALRNMASKKIRAIVTIGGVAVGVGAIVFLVSLGYGLERLVISRVTRLDELKMVDVGLGEVSAMKMNQDMITKIKGMDGVSEVIPVVSMVSKVKFKNSVLDIMALGVDQRYIKAVGAKIIAGKEFTDVKNTGFNRVLSEGMVAGVSTDTKFAREGDLVEKGLVGFDINPGEKVGVWKECTGESNFLGYAVRGKETKVGEERWGERYYLSNKSETGVDLKTNKELSKWVRTKIPLWKETDAGLVPVIGDSSNQVWEIGCIREDEVTMEPEQNITEFTNLTDYLVGDVLGITNTASASARVATASAAAVASPSADIFETTVSKDDNGVEWVELKSVASNKNDVKQLTFESRPTMEAYVSLGMLKIFGMDQDKAIGEKFNVSYIVPDGLVPGITGRLQSEETEYQITGVIDDNTSNYYYFQIGDAESLGVKNYSQLKVITKEQNKVPGVRRSIETLGLRTVSTLDTVAEIEKLFATLRIVLGALGMIALTVAALGMFNTMTVSLLERTREVGVMKAMGMLSNDVRELFLAESMIMGVGGGVFGILLGVTLGKLVSVVLSSVSVLKGQGFIDISYVPWFFTLFILVVSFVVGIITGWYPSRRARQISALNALRYE